MSEVFSFRLSKDNPREVQAREILESWISQGYSLRYIITEALIHFRDNGKHHEEISGLLDQLRGLLSQSTNGGEPGSLENNDKISLPSSFIEAVKKSVKPGEKMA